jgi:DNA polymerase-4
VPGQLVLPGFGQDGGSRKHLHVSVREFPVVVELRRRPELRRQPVVVATPGADGRGTITNCSAGAHDLGLRAGMPLAAARGPGVIVLPLDRGACRAAARELRSVLRTVPGHWTSEGWGEASLVLLSDDTGPAAAAIQRRLFVAMGLTCAIGIGDNALQARLAARLAEPSGVVELNRTVWRKRVGPLPPDMLTGIGPKRRERLHELGLDRVEDVAAAHEPLLVSAFGRSLGPQLHRLARGENGTLSTGRRTPVARVIVAAEANSCSRRTGAHVEILSTSRGSLS